MSVQRMPFQKLDSYTAAREFAQRVHAAKIRDAELRDQATRAAKSVFFNLCEAAGRRPRLEGAARKSKE
jgi:hypothetical protein